MKNKYIYLTLCLLGLLIPNMHAQIVSVTSGSGFNIKAGTVIGAAGLDITPSADFSLTSSLSKSATLSNSTTIAHINRSYKFGATTAAFSGALKFNYQDSELNGLTESNLKLLYNDGSGWLSENISTNNATANYETATLTSKTLNELSLGTSIQTFCNAGRVSNLTPNGSTIKWYAAASGGSVLASSTPLTTATYYYTVTTNGAVSSRIPASVVVNVTPSASVSNQNFCLSATVANLVATGTAIKWYTSSTGGQPLSANVPLLSGAHNFYATQTLNGCESVSRRIFVATVNVTPNPTASSPQTFCYGAKVSNLVTTTGIYLKWYATGTGGTALYSGAVLSSGNYYVSQTINGCESLRTLVTVIVNSTPSPTASTQTLCSGSKISYLVAIGTGIKWYDTATSTAPLATSTSIAGSTTYYASQTLNGCESTRIPVSVSLQVTPAPTAITQSFAHGATVSNLVATGSTIQWYAASTGGVALNSSTALVTATYFCTQTINGCESSRKAVSVRVAAALVGNTVNTIVQKVENSITSQFKTYPNPTRSILAIETSNNETIDKVIVVDLLGKVVLEETPTNNQITVERFASGTYILKVTSGENTFLTKFIKE